MAVRFHPHARERMMERGATEEEAVAAVECGEPFPAKYGRSGFRRNFTFNAEWRAKYYATKQLEVYTVQEGEDWLVITVIVRFF
jgi:hypothetical protein